MRRVISAAAFILISTEALVAQDDWPAPVTEAIETARAECAGFENGTLDVPWNAVTRSDVSGDGQIDYVLDLGRLACSSMASMYCGTGGCSVYFVVEDTVTERLSKGWSVERLGPMTVLLNQIHGANCGGTNLNPCVEAMVWDAEEKRFSTLAK
ncbi:MAG: hypothetical protein QNJ03_15445 [Dinoroseobacter sp.]|nr:hypothetical protein [Dinoroseobacter sp.]